MVRSHRLIATAATLSLLAPLGCNGYTGTSAGSETDGSTSETSTGGSTSTTGGASMTSSTSGGSTTGTSGVDTETGTSGDTGGIVPAEPDLQCPGDPSGLCDESPGAVLEAGAAVLPIIPTCFESWIDENGDGKFESTKDTLLDCGCDRLCPGDPGYAAPDEGEGDKTIQGIWMAGFGEGRAASGVRGADVGLVGEGDGLWVRTIVLRQGNTTLAIVALDTIGYFNDDVETLRAKIVEMGFDVDHLIVHAIHNHEGPDTMGLWGSDFLVPGYDPKYQAEIHDAVLSSIEGAYKVIAPVKEVVVGEVDISTYHDNGVANVISDHRDPWVVDEFLGAARLVGEDDQTIATLISYGCHPETLADENTLLTADFVHAVRRTVESGSTWETAPGVPGLGGPAIYLNAAVGGMMTTLGVEVHDPDGGVYQSASFEKADAIGQLLGEMALDAVANGDVITDPQLSFANLVFFPEVVNPTFKFLFESGVIKRMTYPPAEGSDKMRVRSEMTMVNLGPIQFLSVPGELLPELAVGGYDGSRVNAPGVPLIDPNNPNPPKVDEAPKGPYLKDRMTGTYRWLIGLGNDELGYIIPAYDFQVDMSMPYLQEPEGDHYEETNSLGPHMAGLMEWGAESLATWAKGR